MTNEPRMYTEAELNLQRIQTARTAFDTVLLFIQAGEQTGTGSPEKTKDFVSDLVKAYEKRLCELLGVDSLSVG